MSVIFVIYDIFLTVILLSLSLLPLGKVTDDTKK
jgi:hypothetical protein